MHAVCSSVAPSSSSSDDDDDGDYDDAPCDPHSLDDMINSQVPTWKTLLWRMSQRLNVSANI